MKSLIRILPLAALVSTIFPLPDASAQTGQPYAPVNSLSDETARVLAGLPIRGGHGLEALANSEAARNHAIAMEEMWQQWERFRLANMREWSASVVQPQIPRPRTMFYLFGGPDLVSVVTLFPGADLYTLGGLEPVGQIPDLRQMSAEELAGSLDQIRFNLRPNPAPIDAHDIRPAATHRRDLPRRPPRSASCHHGRPADAPR